MTPRQTLLWTALGFAGVAWWNRQVLQEQLMTGFDLINRLLSREEGRKNYAYKDSAGLWTIGVGHLIKANEQHLLQYTKAKPAPDSLIDDLLRKDTAEATRAVDALRVPLNENERAALISLAFNIGSGAFAGSTLAKKLKAGDKLGAAAEFLKWKIAGGQPVLLERRKREQALFLKATTKVA